MTENRITSLHKSASWTLGILMTVSSLLASITTILFYYYYRDADIQLTTTEPFVNFALLRPVYDNVCASYYTFYTVKW